ncbi:MAG TPA: CBS domain-containing protein [Candidatus Binataceae bacterium]|nr:CBS domain-containing protein [Candidatus Binataceae bacterium]
MGRKGTPNHHAAERLLDEYSTCELWMTRRVRTLAPSDSIERARDLLKHYRINQLPVVARGKLLGIITDRDIRSSLGLRGRGAATVAERRVQSVMSRPAIALGCHSTLLNAAEVMRHSRIGAVPILRGEKLAGIVTRSDILDAFVGLANGRYSRIPPKRPPIRK